MIAFAKYSAIGGARETRRTESFGKFEIDVSPCNFPTVRTRKAICTRRRANARASQCGALRRVELKERRPLKKTGSFFSPRGFGAAPGPPARGSLRTEERDRDLRSDLEFRRRGGGP